MFRLKAKEKILVQLCLHRCESDEGTFPFEVTQKGLSDHLGLRRSHVAVALQELIKDGSVEVVKGHVEGADRRQNVYCITPKGAETATTVRERLLEVEVSFEDASGTSTVKVSEIVTSHRASIASVINQLDRGGPVRDEIAIMTSPEKKLISVFCPTCKKQIEVDNIFFEEEVGFDCPGCGRPYRIVPALKREEQIAPIAPTAARRERPRAITAVIIVIAAMVLLKMFSPTDGLTSFIMACTLIGVLLWILAGGRKERTKYRMPGPKKPRTKVSAVTYTVILSPVLLLLWHFTVASIDMYDTFVVLSPILIGLIIGYVGTAFSFPDMRGDYLLSSGLVLILVAAATMFTVNFGEIEVGMAMFVGIGGAVLVVLSTFHPMDKDAAVLDTALSVGVFLLLLTGIVLVAESSEAIDYIATGSLVLLGLMLIGFRVLRERTGAVDLSGHLLAALPLTAATCLLILGLFMLRGGATVAGIVELAATVPFVYLGSKHIFNDDWPQRVPLVVFFIAVVILVITAGLVI